MLVLLSLVKLRLIAPNASTVFMLATGIVVGGGDSNADRQGTRLSQDAAGRWAGEAGRAAAVWLETGQ